MLLVTILPLTFLNEYNPDVNVLVLRIRDRALANEEILDNDIILGYDKDGKLLYVEMRDASKKD